MTKKLFPKIALLAAVLVGCAPEDVPSSPSWDQDVFPILQGSCGHCHGWSVRNVMGAPTTRFDMCWTKNIADAQVPLPVPDALFNAAKLSSTWFGTDGYLSIKKGKTRPLMPPPPAAPLTDYERGVLEKWAKRAAVAPDPGAGQVHPSCAKQTRNRDPKAVVVGQALDGDRKLVVTIEVSDPDDDQVVGKVTAGTAPAQTILATGRRGYVFEGVSEGAEIKVTLHDGYVAAPVVLTF